MKTIRHTPTHSSRSTFRSVVRIGSLIIGIQLVGIMAYQSGPSPMVVCAADSLAIADVKREGMVDFEKEILPILRKKCLACHNTTKAESELILENPQTILKGGGLGPAAVAGKGADSLLVKVAARQDEPFMPPDGNKVGAERLTPEELGLIRLWIDQGAKGEVKGTAAIKWQPLPPGVNPIYAVAVTPDGHYAAAGRANQIFVFHVPSKRELGRLTDPALLTSGIYTQPGVADLDMIQSLKFSPNGEWLASGGYRTVKLWHRPQNVKIADLPNTESAARAAAVSPDGKYIALGDDLGRIRLLDSASKQIVRVLQAHTGSVTSISFTADSAKLASTSKDGSWRIWNVADGSMLARVETGGELNSGVFLAKGVQFATAGQDNLLRIWSVPSKAITLPNVTAPVTSIAASNDKKWMAVGTAEGKLVLVDMTQNVIARTLEAHLGGVSQVAFNSAGNRLVTLGADTKIRVWNPADGKELATVSAGLTKHTAVAVDAAGNQLVAGAADGSLRSWKLNSAEQRQLSSDNGIAATVSALSHDRKILATGGQAEGKPVVFLRDLATGNVVRTLAGHDGAITSLSFSLDHARVISGSEDRTARVWNVADGAEVAKLAQHATSIIHATLNSNGQQALTTSADGGTTIWNIADGKAVATLEGQAGFLVGQLFSHDNQFAVTLSSDRTLRWWNASNGQLARAIDVGAAGTALAISRDGQRVAAGTALRQVRIYQVADGQLVSTLIGHQAPPVSISYSLDNSRIASSDGKQLFVWDGASGRALEDQIVDTTFVSFAGDSASLVLGQADKSIRVHALRIERMIGDMAKSVSAVAYTPDSQGIITTSEDGTVRRFATASGQQQFSVSHGAPVHAMAVSPNGQWIATGGEDKLLKVFSAGNGAPAGKPQLAGFTGSVRRVVFSQDSTKVAGADSSANRVLVFDVADGLLDQQSGYHPGQIGGLAAISLPDQSSVIVSAGSESLLRALPLAAGRKISGHPQPVTSLAAINDSQLISGCADGIVRHWDTGNGQMVRQMNHGGPVESVAARTDGQRFASASSNNSIKLWDGANGQQVAEMKGDYRSQIRVSEMTRAVALAKRKVDSANADLKAAQDRKTAEEKNATTVAEAKKKADEELGKKVEALKQPTADKEAADKALVDANSAQTKAEAAVKVADENVAKTAEALAKAQKELEAATKVAADSANAAKQAAEKLAKAKEAAKADVNNATLAEAAKAAEKESQETEAKSKVSAEAKTAAEKKNSEADLAKKGADEAKKKADQDLAAAKTAVTSADAKVKQVTPVAQKAIDEKTAAERAVQAAARSVERANASVKKAADEIPAFEKAVGSETEASKRIEAALEETKKTATTTEQPVRRVVFSTDGKTLFSGGDDQVIHSWDGTSGLAVENYEGNNAAITAIAAGPNGQLISAAQNHAVAIWNTQPEWRLARVIGNVDDPNQLVDRVTALDFSPDSRLIATGSGEPSRSGQLKIWDLTTGALQRELKDPHSDTILGIEFSPDGRLIASSGADRFAKIFQVSDGKFVRAFEGHTHHVLGVAWRADGRILATAGADSVIKVWNTRTGDQERTIQGFGKEVTGIRFVAEGDVVVASAGDNTVRMKNAANGGNVRDFGGATDFVYSVSISADGKYVVAGGQDSTLRVWSGDNGQIFTAFEAPKAPVN